MVLNMGPLEWESSALTGVPSFSLKVLLFKAQHFHTKLICHKPLLRQIECGVQNEPIAKNAVLQLTTIMVIIL